MDNLDVFFKCVVVDLPNATRMIYTPFISMVVLTTKTRIYIKEKWLTKKNYSGHAEYFLHFVCICF